MKNMHRKLMALGAMAALGVFAVGCAAPFARTPVIAPIGWIYENTKAPLSVNYNNTEVTPGKTGTAKTTYVCGWPLIPNSSFAWDDASIETAARNGGLNEVAYADYQTYNILGIYSVFTVTAYGK